MPTEVLRQFVSSLAVAACLSCPSAAHCQELPAARKNPWEPPSSSATGWPSIAARLAANIHASSPDDNSVSVQAQRWQVGPPTSSGRLHELTSGIASYVGGHCRERADCRQLAGRTRTGYPLPRLASVAWRIGRAAIVGGLPDGRALDGPRSQSVPVCDAGTGCPPVGSF